MKLREKNFYDTMYLVIQRETKEFAFQIRVNMTPGRVIQ